MSVETTTSAQYAKLLASAIKQRNNKIETSIGPVADIVINPVSTVLEKQNTDTRKLQSLLSLLNNGDYTRDDLIAFVANEGIIPDAGDYATVMLKFSTSRVTSDRSVMAGYPVSTQTGESDVSSLMFVTTQTAVLPYASRASYFNSVTQRYELMVPARCTTQGAIGQVAANRINRPMRPLFGFEIVTNPDPTRDGRDPASDIELIEQYLIAITGTDESVEDGIRRIIRDTYAGVADSLVVYGNDPLLVRAATDAGAVDTWVIAEQLVGRTDVATFAGPLQAIPLLRQPVAQVTSVSVGSTVYIENVDYSVIRDMSGYSGSVKATDYIMFKPSGSLPAIGASVTINYTQNVTIENIQSTFNNRSNLVLGRDMLIRAATKLDFYMSAIVTIGAGYDTTSSTLTDSINTAIVDFVNATLLKARQPGVSDGGSLQISDIDAVVRRIAGIDNFVFTRFALAPTITTIVDIPVLGNQYIRAVSSNVVLTPA